MADYLEGTLKCIRMGDYCDLFFVGFLYFCSHKLKTSKPG